jgi:hypothetical protein
MALLAQALPGIEPVIALVTLAYSPLLRTGIFVLHALASSPQLRWLLLHYKAAQDTSLLQSWPLSWHELMSSPALRWHHASIALVSLPSTRWRRRSVTLVS